jgi:5S rRNA maturation endonuclease (ribonuclease M5)
MRYDSTKIKKYKSLSKESILEEVSEEEIMRHYLGFDFEIGRMYQSPLRDDDVPSFNIYYSEYQELRYKDFNGSQGTCFDLVMNLKSCNFYNALCNINDEFGLCLGGKTGNKKVSYKEFKAEIIEKKCLIQFKPQHFTELDKQYWFEKYNITKLTLEIFNVYSAKFVFLNKTLLFRYTNNSPIYCYKFEDKVKVYRPFQPKGIYKWLSNAKMDTVQGHAQLHYESNTLIITKSLKDVMCLYEMGYESIAPQAETTHLNESILTNIIKNYKNIYILFDSDSAGQWGAEILGKKITGSKVIFIPKNESKAKDLSDVIEMYSFEFASELIKKLINE